MENDTLKQQLALLQQTLREFSQSDSMDYEETYEAVLRSEFELMR